MSLAADLAILLGSILLSAYFSGTETGAYTLSRLRLRYRTERGMPAARILTDLLSRMEVLVTTILLGNNVVAYASAVVVTSIFQETLHDELKAEIASTVALTPVLFVFAEVLPKEVFRIRADTFVYEGARALYAFTWLFFPFTYVLRGIIGILGRLIGEEARGHTLELSAARLAFSFSQGTQAGVLTPYQDQIARNIIGLREVRVRDVRIPLEKVVVASNAVGRDELLDLAKESGYSRIPIWQGIRTRIIGVVHVFDVLAEDRPGLTIRNYIREVPAISPDASIYQALLVLQTSHTPLGVVQRDGRALGIVTVEDLLEEVVGELEE